MPSGLLKSEAVRLGLAGVVVGAFAPLFHTFFQLVVFHSDMTVAGYFRREFLFSREEMASTLFICGAVVVMGAAGFLVGRLREKDARHRSMIESSNRELAALNSIAEIIAKTRELDAVLHLVLKETLSLSFLSIERKGAVFLVDEGRRGMLNMAASIGMDPYILNSEKCIEPGHCLCGKAARAGEIITSADCFEDEAHTTRYPGMERHGHVVVPITSRQQVLGVMTFYLPPCTEPSGYDIRILSSIAGQLGVAIENSRLMQSVTVAKEDIHKKALELARNIDTSRALAEVDRIILFTMNKDEMLFKVSAQIRHIVPADVGGVALKDPGTGNCVYNSGWGLDMKRGEIIFPSGCHVNPALKAGEPLLRPDLDEKSCQMPLDRMLLDAGVRANAYVPIVRKGKPAGLFFLGSYRADGISTEDIDAAVTFAARMGIALEHASLMHNMEEMSVNIIHALATAIDAKSPWTQGHSERVADYAMHIAERMGMDRQRMERLRLAGLLHDIGKIGTYDVLLDKEGRLTEDELDLIKQHPQRGCEILSPIKELWDILPAVRHHHERWDGNGYPDGLKGDDIPVEARIICVADSFDTMTADRPYRPSIGLENAIKELKYCSGSQFAPEVVDVFLGIIKERGAALTKSKAMPYRFSGQAQRYSSPNTAM